MSVYPLPFAYLGVRRFSARCTASSDENDTTCEILIAGIVLVRETLLSESEYPPSKFRSELSLTFELEAVTTYTEFTFTIIISCLADGQATAVR